MDKESKKQREITGYLKPSNVSFIKGYIEVQRISKSAAVNDAIKALKACQPPEVLQKILQNK